MIRLAAPVLIAAVLAGCSSLPEPAVTQQLTGDYQRIAACVYERESRIEITGLRMTDLRASHTILINKDQVTYSTAPMWEARLSRAGTNLTAVEIKAFPTVWGADFNARSLMANLKACSTSG